MIDATESKILNPEKSNPKSKKSQILNPKNWANYP